VSFELSVQYTVHDVSGEEKINLVFMLVSLNFNVLVPNYKTKLSNSRGSLSVGSNRMGPPQIRSQILAGFEQSAYNVAKEEK
jgi:hypothetical protein